MVEVVIIMIKNQGGRMCVNEDSRSLPEQLAKGIAHTPSPRNANRRSVTSQTQRLVVYSVEQRSLTRGRPGIDRAIIGSGCVSRLSGGLVKPLAALQVRILTYAWLHRQPRLRGFACGIDEDDS